MDSQYAGENKVGKVLVLRTCSDDMISHGGFVWPRSGPVEAPDWEATAECGHGLHGLLWGEGDGNRLDWSDGAIWLVVEVEGSDVVDLGGKVKFPRGNVVFCGDRPAATAYLAGHGGHGRAIAGGTATVGPWGTATVGYRGTATAGPGGAATAGRGGTATAGPWGTATVGPCGTATVGNGGTATAGPGGTILVKWWDDSSGRYRIAVGYVGEDGILPGVPYRVEDGKLVRADG